MGSKLPIAIVGVGRIGRLHAQNAADSKIMDLVAIVDSNSEAAKRVADELRVPNYFTTIDKLVQADVARAAVVASPTNYHVEHSLKLLEAGYKVLLEKPLSHNLESAERLMEYLGHAKNRLMHAFMRRFDPAYLEAKGMIDKGLIGDIYRINSTLEDSQPPPPEYISSGILIDMAVHNVDEVLWLMGKQSVHQAATGHNVNSGYVNEPYNVANMQITFADNSVAFITVAREHSAGYHVETVLYGTKGNIYVGQFNGNDSRVPVIAYGRKSKLLRRYDFPIMRNDEQEPEFITRFREAYRRELKYFATQSLAGQDFSVNQLHGMEALRIAFQGQELLKQQSEMVQR